MHIERLRRYLAFTLVSVVLLSAIPFGAARPWSWSLLGVLFTGLSLVTVMIQFGRRDRAPAALQIAGILFFIFLAITIVISEPFLISEYPATHLISPNVHTSETAILRITSYACVFWCSFALFRNHETAVATLRLIIAAGTIHAIYALIIQYSGVNLVLWLPKWTSMNVATGTFVARVHFGFYMAMIFTVTLSLFIAQFRNSIDVTSDLKEFTVDVIEFLSSKSGIIILFCLLVILLAVFESGSRGALISLFASLSTLVAINVIYSQMPRSRKAGVVALVLSVLLILCVLLGTPIFDRIGSSFHSNSLRLDAFVVAIEAIRDRPLLGWGLGSYPDLVELYRPLDRAVSWRHAHNDYLEHMADLGVVLFALWGIVLFIPVWLCLKGISLRDNRPSVFVATSLSLCIAVCVSSLWDFVLQIPAITYLFACFLGIGVSRATQPWK